MTTSPRSEENREGIDEGKDIDPNEPLYSRKAGAKRRNLEPIRAHRRLRMNFTRGGGITNEARYPRSSVAYDLVRPAKLLPRRILPLRMMSLIHLSTPGPESSKRHQLSRPPRFKKI
jgi:hypothetical protein